MQGIAQRVEQKYDDPDLLEYTRHAFYGFDSCLKTLFVVVCGPDWLLPHDALSQYSGISAMIMPSFVVFTNIGVMNIVIGVFANASANSKDRTAIAMDQIKEVEDFAQDMLDLMREYTPDCTEVSWQEFREYFYREHVQAYLSYHGLDTSHVALIFSLIDNDNSGKVDIREFIIGCLRLKGSASGLNQRVMMHGIKYLSQDLVDFHENMKSMMVQRKQTFDV
mmetsp:Transcript_56517/g.103316  ORF Transcript_56517/g.103316 Transcript_56517/m.103316 type:complete len:222 (-) Transcript_56517:65-730(-)